MKGEEQETGAQNGSGRKRCQTNKGAKYEWHCRLVGKELRQAAVMSSSLAICLGRVKSASNFGLLFWLGARLYRGDSPPFHCYLFPIRVGGKQRTGKKQNSAAETRTHNEANELTAFGLPSTTIDPTLDDAGNMTKIPQASDPTTKFDLVYDAWNRLVEVKNHSGTTVTANEYDGLNRRGK